MGRSYYKGEEPVPGYKLIQPLGRGGFGEVWKATGPGGIPVALKIIGLTGKQGFKELRAIQRVKLIRHPNLVPITAFWLKDNDGNVLTDAEVESSGGKATGRASELIMAMGLGDKSLFDRLEECTRKGMPGIPPDELLSYLEDTARAIDHLNSPRHDLGSGPVAIQHCDIKPQNIMIVGGAAQVCDFGLARVLGDVRATTAAMSPAYSAPECLKENKPSEFTDQYSLAVSYYELRTGTLPFERDSYMEVVNAHLEGKLDLSKVSRAEQVVLRRATAVNPSDRYPTTQAMVRALRLALEGSTGTAATQHKLPGTSEAQPGTELVPGYKLIRPLAHGMRDDVWEATAPGGKPVALVVRWIHGAARSEDFIALDLLIDIEHDHLTEPHAYWLLDENGQVIPDDRRTGPRAVPAVMVVIAGKLARKSIIQRLEECRAATGTGIPVAELIGYMRQLASAIDYLNEPRHKRGDCSFAIYHRDVRPMNVLLQGTTVRLGNFSLARVAEGGAACVAADPTGLDVNYAAPEAHLALAARGSDQYSLAITYYELRTGRLPFDSGRTSGEIAGLHQRGGLDFTGLPESERSVLARATDTKPEERFPTCAEFVAALAATSGHEALPVESIRKVVSDRVPAPPAVTASGLAPVPSSSAASSTLDVTQPVLRGTMMPQVEPESAAPAMRRSILTETPTHPVTETAPSPAAAHAPVEQSTREPVVDDSRRAPTRSRARAVGMVGMLAAVIVAGIFVARDLFPDKSGDGRNPPTPTPTPTPGPTPLPHKPPDEPKPSPPGLTKADQIRTVRTNVMRLVEGRAFDEALKLARTESGELGDQAEELVGEVVVAWVEIARKQLDAGEPDKAAESATSLIKTVPDRVEGYLLLADSRPLIGSADSADMGLGVFWSAPRGILADARLTARLRELHDSWVRQRLPQLERAEDFRVMLETITKAEQASPDAVTGLLLACKAECLLESDDGTQSQANLKQAASDASDKRVVEAGGYGHFVRALILLQSKQPDQAAVELSSVTDTEFASTPFDAPRRQRAAEVFEQAVVALRGKDAAERSSAPSLEFGPNPFGTAERADAACRYAERAIRLFDESAPPKSPGLGVNLALAAWFKTERDAARVREITDQLLDQFSRDELGAASVSLLLMNIESQADSAAGRQAKLGRYAAILDHFELGKRRSESDPLQLYNQVVQPALQVAGVLGDPSSYNEQQRKQLGRVLATKGQLIIYNWFARWEFDEKAQEAINAFDQAIGLDETQADCFVGKAAAMARLSRPNWKGMEEAAITATKLDPNKPAGHAMVGYAQLLGSRSIADPNLRKVKLNEALANLNRAVEIEELTRKSSPELASFLTNRSTTLHDLGHAEGDATQRRQHFSNAAADADRAATMDRRYPEVAWSAAGHARETMASVLGETEQYDKAVAAFEQAIKEREGDARSWLDCGRCLYRWAFAAGNTDTNELAIGKLQKAVGLDSSLAEAHYWLGWAYDFKKNYAESDSAFRAAIAQPEAQQNQIDSNFYAGKWGVALLLGVKTGVNQKPPDAAAVSRLNAFRSWLTEQKQKPEYGLMASWLMGQSYEIEGKYREALAEYDDALPKDLSDAEAKHIRLLQARAVCRSSSKELMNEDFRQAGTPPIAPRGAGDSQSPRQPTPRPLLALRDADRAVELAADSPSEKIVALSTAAELRTALAQARPVMPRELVYRREAILQLAAAIGLASTDATIWKLRQKLGDWTLAILSDPKFNLDDDTRARFREVGLNHLDLALKTPGLKDVERDRLLDLREKIRVR